MRSILELGEGFIGRSRSFDVLPRFRKELRTPSPATQSMLPILCTAFTSIWRWQPQDTGLLPSPYLSEAEARWTFWSFPFGLFFFFLPTPRNINGTSQVSGFERTTWEFAHQVGPRLLAGGCPGRDVGTMVDRALFTIHLSVAGVLRECDER